MTKFIYLVLMTGLLIKPIILVSARKPMKKDTQPSSSPLSAEKPLSKADPRYTFLADPGALSHRGAILILL